MNVDTKNTPILRSANNGIIIEGLEEGESLELYSTNGMMIDKVTSSGASATLGHD